MRPKSLLHFDDRRQTGARRREHGKESVALRRDLGPVVSCEAGADELVMIGESLGVGVATEAAEEPRRALDVGKEEGQCLRGKSLRDCSAQWRGWWPTSRSPGREPSVALCDAAAHILPAQTWCRRAEQHDLVLVAIGGSVPPSSRPTVGVCSADRTTAARCQLPLEHKNDLNSVDALAGDNFDGPES